MGHLFFINDSFELSHTHDSNRNTVIKDFCDSIDLMLKNGDHTYADVDFYSREYSYGNIYSFYQSWGELKRNKVLHCIDEKTFQLFHGTMQAVPFFAKYINNLTEFEITYSNLHKGFSGFRFGNPRYTPFVCCEKTWHEWKANWFAVHQREINWNYAVDVFLPNKNFSDNILKEEVIRHTKQDKINQYNGSYSLVFYEEVMKHKGHLTDAYAREIGSQIAKANYYVIDLVLSKAERMRTGSLRAIFRIINKIGKTQYLSIDHKHGMFEYYDERGNHLGEHRFDGTNNKAADPTHNLNTLI